MKDKKASDKKLLKEVVYDSLRNKILNGEFHPGTVLNERDLSHLLGVSRTPVREALKALEVEDLVEHIPYTGVVVKEMNLRELRNIFEVRTVLEVFVVKLAFEKINREIMRTLQQCIDDQDKFVRDANDKLQEFMRLDMEFHNILASTTDNPLLKQLIEKMRIKAMVLGINALNVGVHRFTETIEEHQAIHDALEKGDLAQAMAAMERHIQNTYDSAYEALVRN